MDPPDLIDIARSAAGNARAPYSRFPVGAAVEGDDGRIYPGCNIESASYPLTMCAERVAIFSAIAAGASPSRIAVSCLRGDPSDLTSIAAPDRSDRAPRNVNRYRGAHAVVR